MIYQVETVCYSTIVLYERTDTMYEINPPMHLCYSLIGQNLNNLRKYFELCTNMEPLPDMFESADK